MRVYTLILSLIFLLGCNSNSSKSESSLKVTFKELSVTLKTGEVYSFTPTVNLQNGITFSWMLAGEEVSSSNVYQFKGERAGLYSLKLKVSNSSGDSKTVELSILVEVVPSLRASKRPFPQHVSYTEGVILPNNITQQEMDDKVVEFYYDWKRRYVKKYSANELYVHYTLEYKVGNALSCSEGHGFGMVVVAYMAGADSTAYDTFVKLYNFYKSHPTQQSPYLMAWQQDSKGSTNGVNSATDGDLDIAYSLLLADKQWGSDGEINFKQEALKMIDAIHQFDISPEYNMTNLGSWSNASTSDAYRRGSRSCDYMVDHLRCFDLLSGKTQFSTVIDNIYKAVNASAHEVTGLLPDFVVAKGDSYVAAQPKYLEGPNDGFYYYNSCRAPLRLPIDYILNGDHRANKVMNNLNVWIKNKTDNNPINILQGYKLDGTALVTYGDMAFTAPFGVSAMIHSDHQEWLNRMWNTIIDKDVKDAYYFGNSIKMLSIIVMSGNYWSPSQD